MRRSSLAAVSFFALLSGVGSVTPGAWAEEGSSVPSVTVRTGVHTEYDRVVFDFTRKTDYTLKRNGSQAVITFDAAAKPVFDAYGLAQIERAHHFSSKISDGHLVVSFDVEANAEVVPWLSGNSVAIDIRGLAVKHEAEPVVPKKTTAPETKAETSVAPTPVEPQDKTSVKDAEAATNAPQKILPETSASKSVPLAKTSSKVAAQVPVAPLQPTAAPQTSVPQAPSQATPQTTSAPMVSTPVVEAKPEAKISSPTPIAAPIPAAAAVAPVAAAAPVVPTIATPSLSSAAAPALLRPITASPAVAIGDTPVLVLSLDPHVATRAVVLSRAGYVYIVLSRKLTLSPSDLVGSDGVIHVTIEPVDLPKSTAYRFALPADLDVHVSREGTVWKIYLSHQKDEVPISTTLVPQPDFALGARLLLPLPDAPEPIRFTDPVVGDDLIMVPLAQNEAFSVPRTMVDFKVVPAAQGLVIKPLTDHVIARVVTDGVEITAEGGLRLSSANDTGASKQSSQRAKAAENGKSLFDFASWSGKPEETFTQTRQRLMQTIVDVPEAERNRARLELARFYFAHGNGAESLSLLKYLAKELPDLMGHADFLALLGASEILAHRPEDGLQHLDTPLLRGQPEVDLWQAVASAELRNWKEAEERFALSSTQLYGYPEPFHSRFTILAVEAALAVDNDHEAADWLDRLDTSQHSASVDPAIRYLYAALHAKAGRAQSAESAWTSVLNTNDRLYKIRSELALVDLRVATGSLTPSQAADRLEALRFGWRGDDLEVDILHRLGQFYVQAKNIKSGLATMSQAVHLYPSSPMTPGIKTEMSKVFHDVFMSDLGANMSPLDALTLYQQYRDLMPNGADGDTVTRNLAERLVEVDLLDQASSLLEDMIKNRLQGEDKARTSARLAAIRLLDHKPDLALAALDLGASGFLPPDVQNERLLLRAKALSGLQRDDEALALLQNNNHASATLLRADITMHAHRWDEAAKALLELIGPPPLAGTSLSRDQADWLLNCAIAYALSGNTAGLDKLAIDYTASVAGTPQSDTFRVLTSPDKSTQLRDLTAAQARITDVDMFQGFLNSYRKSGNAPPAKK